MRKTHELAQRALEESTAARQHAARAEEYMRNRGTDRVTSAETLAKGARLYQALKEGEGRLRCIETDAPSFIADNATADGDLGTFFAAEDVTFQRGDVESSLQAFATRCLSVRALQAGQLDHFDVSATPIFETGDKPDTAFVVPGMTPRPSDVVTVIEWKRWPKTPTYTFPPDYKGQVLSYAFQILDAQRWRRSVCVALCNLDVIQIFVVTRTKPTAGLDSFASLEYQPVRFLDGRGRGLLHGMLAIEPSFFGYDVVKPRGVDPATITAWAGGATAVVFKHTAESQAGDVVIKAFRDDGARDKEVEVYTALGESFRKKSCTAESCHISELVDAPDGANYIVLKDAGTSMSPFTPTTAAADIVGALRFAHECAGYVHRDVRPANIAVRWVGGRCRAVLLDWGSAAKIGAVDDAFVGTRTFASSTVLNDPASYKPEDDLASLVRTVIFLKELHGMGVPRSGSAIADLTTFWEELVLPVHYVDMERAAARCDYDALKRLLSPPQK